MSRQTNFTQKVSLNSPDRKLSVFERLGSKANIASSKNICHNWMQNGTCPLNRQCKLAQTHILISPSKRSKSEAMKKAVTHKKCKDEHKKTQKAHQNSDVEWDGWELGDLEDADEKALERRKQELQRELQLQLKKEKELTRKKEKRNDKKRAASSSSSSTTTTESSSTSTSSTTSSSEPRKRTARKRKHSSSSSDSERSLQRPKKNPKTPKVKTTVVRKPLDKKETRVSSDVKNKSVVVSKKTSVQKKTYNSTWEKSRTRSSPKQVLKKSPHHSPDASQKNKSSPRYEKSMMKNKSRGYSPKVKTKEVSPKRAIRKLKESSVHVKEKPRQSPNKTSPARARKVSPTRPRRHDDSSSKRRNHYEDPKHSPRRDRSREKDRKDVRRTRSNDDDNNGGLKKGGKILPLKPPVYNKESIIKKDSTHHKSSDKISGELKSKDEIFEKDRNRMERDKDRGEKEKKCERDRSKHKKDNEEQDRRREKEPERGAARVREERGRERENDRLRFTKEREMERQKERDDALERCRERQRERERLEKERKEKDDRKHQKEINEIKSKEYESELPSLLDIKAEDPGLKNSGESTDAKLSEKHITRDNRKLLDKNIDKPLNQDRNKDTPDREKRDSRRIDENDKRQADKDYDSRRSREEIRNSLDVRRSLGEANESRRQWEEIRRSVDIHDRRRPLESVISDRRQHPLSRRPLDDPYRRGRDADIDGRDFPVDDRRGRKLVLSCSDWDSKDQKFDYRDSEVIRDDWNNSDRLRDWNPRYEHKWMEREENRDSNWNHYPRRLPHEDWNGEWPQEQSRQMFSEERLDIVNEGFSEQNRKRGNESEGNRPDIIGAKAKEAKTQEDSFVSRGEKQQKGNGDALSDISDDPDDILNQDDDAVEDAGRNNSNNSNQQIYIKSNEFLFDQRRSLLECLGERSLDFEEISDEELEEEARASKGIVDVLGADWAGLLQETRPKPQRPEGSGSAHRRWMSKKLVLSLGISVKYAGEDFSNRFIEELEKVSHVQDVDLVNSTEKSQDDENEVKDEENEEKAAEEKELYNSNPQFDTSETTFNNFHSLKEEFKIINFLHPVPALHNAMKEAQEVKSFLFSSHNRFKRALSARTDLALRREFCSLPSKEPLHFAPPLDNRIYETSIQLFQNDTTTVAV